MESKIYHFARTNQSSEELVQELYAELKRIARGKVAMERSDNPISPTTLVHEAWLRLEKSAPELWRDRSQFFAAASEAMRRILVEAARRRLAEKRGAGQVPLQIDEIDIPGLPEDERIMAIHEVLDQLEEIDPRKAQIVKLRFFVGLENQEIAALLDVNEKTVRRDWELAKVWIFRALVKP